MGRQLRLGLGQKTCKRSPEYHVAKWKEELNQGCKGACQGDAESLRELLWPGQEQLVWMANSAKGMGMTHRAKQAPAVHIAMHKLSNKQI
jgi:hypothetical protein